MTEYRYGGGFGKHITDPRPTVKIALGGLAIAWLLCYPQGVQTQTIDSCTRFPAYSVVDTSSCYHWAVRLLHDLAYGLDTPFGSGIPHIQIVHVMSQPGAAHPRIPRFFARYAGLNYRCYFRLAPDTPRDSSVVVLVRFDSLLNYGCQPSELLPADLRALLTDDHVLRRWSTTLLETLLELAREQHQVVAERERLSAISGQPYRPSSIPNPALAAAASEQVPADVLAGELAKQTRNFFAYLVAGRSSAEGESTLRQIPSMPADRRERVGYLLRLLGSLPEE